MARLHSVRTLAGAPPPSAAILLNCGRRLSGLPEATQLPGFEDETEGCSVPPAETRISLLEEAIHAIRVSLSAPDWLPFVPGSSYWVPPRKCVARGVTNLSSRVGNPMTAEEIMSFTSIHGWPSLTYFVEGASSRPLLVTQQRTDAESGNEEC